MLGTPRVHYRRCDSTNARLRELAAAGAPAGSLVTAGEQTAGRGRQGRSWAAPPGQALLCSLLLRDLSRLLPLQAGLAVAEVCQAFGHQAAIKWPNDVLIDGRKVAGILVEGRPQEGWAVLGVGLNVAIDPHELPPELRPTAATLGQAPSAVEPALCRLLERLQRWLAASGADVLTAVRERDALHGRTVTWQGGSGTAAGIDGEGRLQVELDAGAGRVALDSGEVHLQT